MTRTKKRQKKPEAQHTHLAVCVESYEASVEAGVNHNVYNPQYAWNLDNSDPLYEFKTRLMIMGTASYPDTRAGDRYELTIYASDGSSRRLDATLKDVQVRDGEYGAPQYREYRGKQIPVYDPPHGIGALDKIRGEPRWTAWLHASPKFVTDALILLGQGKTLYLAIHERKVERTRWVQSMSLQSTNPDEE